MEITFFDSTQKLVLLWKTPCYLLHGIRPNTVNIYHIVGRYPVPISWKFGICAEAVGKIKITNSYPQSNLNFDDSEKFYSARDFKRDFWFQFEIISST